MRITVNLATRPFADTGPAVKRLRIAMASLVVLCILLGVGLHLFDREAAEARARDHSLDGQIARLQAERTSAEAFMTRPDNAQLLQQAEFLNQRFDEKAFSWTLAMQAMETVLPAGVQVTAIEPLRDKDGHITVHLRVVGPRDKAVDLVSNIEKSRRFLQPRIVGESAESTSGPVQRQEPISASNRFEFDILTDYNPPTPEERSPAKNSAKASTPKSGAPGSAPHTAPHRARPNPATPENPASPAPSSPQAGRPPYTGSAPSEKGPSYDHNNPPGGPQ